MRRIILISALTAFLCSLYSTAMAADSGLEFHGYMQNRIYAAPGANAEFRSERISLSTKAALPNNSLAYVELYYHPWTASNGLYLESAYYETPVDGGQLRIGKGRRVTFGITPSYPNRKTSNYGIVAEAITQDRIQGIQYLRDFGKINLAASIHTADRLGIRNVGEIPGDDVRNSPAGSKEGHVIPHLSLRDPHSGGGNPSQTPGQLSRKMQIASRVGVKLTAGLSAGLSGSFASLDERDLANLRGSAGSDNILRPRNPLTNEFPTTPIGTNFSEKNMSQVGLDMTYKQPGGFVAQGEWYGSSVSNLDYNAWDILTGMELQSGWKFFVRYSQQNMDTPATNNPLTWDITQTSFSVVQPLRKNLWLQYEYELNGEKTDTGADVDNDLFFVELFSAF